MKRNGKARPGTPHTARSGSECSRVNWSLEIGRSSGIGVRSLAIPNLMHRILFAAALLAATASAETPKPETPKPTDGDAPASPAASRITFSQCHVEGPYIAMTFDDGPHGVNTPRLLDMLKQRGIKATFFMCGECVAQFPQIVKRIVDEGHEIGNHSWSHPQLSKMGEESVTDQLQRTHDAIKQAGGIEPKLMRPPYGAFTANQRSWANHKWGYKIILWDVDPLDWKVRNAEHVEHEILAHTVAGSIVLSHDIHKTTVDAMPATLDGLIAKGFKFVTVSELLGMDKPVPPKPKATPAPKAPSAPLAPKTELEKPAAAKAS
jgi:peptidoglycan/xylan/chitin deacetylase (PgdA/CDA1 family)